MKSMSYFSECTHGIQSLGCEIAMVVGAIIVVLKLIERMKCRDVCMKRAMMNMNWQKRLKRVFMREVSGLQKIGWSEKIRFVLFIDVELVVMTQRRN